MFIFSLDHATCITIYWFNQPISFYGADTAVQSDISLTTILTTYIYSVTIFVVYLPLQTTLLKILSNSIHKHYLVCMQSTKKVVIGSNH